MKPTYKRRHYFIDGKFQGQHVFNSYVLVLIVIVLFVGLFSFFTSDALTIVYTKSDLQLERTPLILLKKILLIAWILLIPGGIWITLRTILVSHRMAGPLFKLEKTMDEMCQGKIGEKIYLRQKDHCKDLAEKINALNTLYAEKISDISLLAQQIEESAHGTEDPEVKLQKIEALSKNLQQSARFFTVVNDQ
ncbi:MAG: methyl-accepting chemotaxis protein [Proteobacteria bacterium]|nr:methyl-accepting chemotaxis protein [Pseudomonadota bacterium]MBU4117359.1 methyl-accepting chemotaxis protein [Pseudomonadota bacterium]